MTINSQLNDIKLFAKSVDYISENLESGKLDNYSDKIIDKLIEQGATVKAYDPEAMSNVRKQIEDKIDYALNEYDALDNADALIICTEWSVFRTPDFKELDSRLKSKTIFDGRNLYEVKKMRERGYFYRSIGRETVNNK